MIAGVQTRELVVRADEDEQVEPLAEEAVGEVQQALQPLTHLLLLVAEELAAVLEHEEPPALRGLFVVVGVEEDPHEVVGIAEQPVGVEHVFGRRPSAARRRPGSG